MFFYTFLLNYLYLWICHRYWIGLRKGLVQCRRSVTNTSRRTSNTDTSVLHCLANTVSAVLDTEIIELVGQIISQWCRFGVLDTWEIKRAKSNTKPAIHFITDIGGNDTWGTDNSVTARSPVQNIEHSDDQGKRPVFNVFLPSRCWERSTRRANGLLIKQTITRLFIALNDILTKEN